MDAAASSGPFIQQMLLKDPQHAGDCLRCRDIAVHVTEENRCPRKFTCPGGEKTVSDSACHLSVLWKKVKLGSGSEKVG